MLAMLSGANSLLTAIPEDAVASLIDLMRPYDGNIARQSSLHEKFPAIELPHLPLLTKPYRFTLFIEPSWNFTILQQRIHSRRCVESRNARTTSSYPLRKRTLRTKLNFNTTAQILLLQRLIIPQETYNKLLNLSALGEKC